MTQLTRSHDNDMADVVQYVRIHSFNIECSFFIICEVSKYQNT